MTLKLYIQPKTILFAARVNEAAAATYPRDYITYDNVTTGTYSQIGLNMTVLIGSSAGGYDLGITRVRKAPTSSVLYIGRSSKGVRIGEVTLTDNAYITVLSESRIWSKVPFIDSDGVTLFDSDLDYATYGASSPPVANAGPAVVGEIDSGTSLLTVNFSASNSFVTMPGAAIASYFWNVGGGTITVGTSASENITATFPAGFHLVSLLVADDNAESHTAYVPVLAINPAADPCIYNFEIQSHRITPSGQELSLRIREDIDEATYLDGAWCALVDGDPADGDDRSNIIFQGWLQSSDESIDGTPTGLLTDVTLTALDVAGRLKQLPGYSTVIEHAASPANWQQMTTPQMARYLHYLLQWQSNALDVADFTLYGDEDDYTFKILASDGASLWEQVNRRAEALIPDHLFVCNRLGQLAIKVDQMLLNTGDRTATVQVALDSDDYDNLRYSQQRQPRHHWLRSNAILTGTTTVAAAFCIAPGDAPGQGPGALDDGEHLALTQSALNDTTGHRYARLNAFQSLLNVTLAESNPSYIDPAALTWVTLDLPSAVAAQRGLTLSTARTLCKLLECRYNNTETGLVKTWTAQLELEVTSGVAATTVTVEAATPVDDGNWLPADPIEPFNNNLTSGQDVVGFIARNGYIYTCIDFTTPGEPTWSRNTSAATAASIGSNDLYTFVVDPFSPGYRGTPSGAINGWCAGETAVYRVTDLFGTPAYTAVYTYTTAANLTHEWAQIGCSFGRYEVDESDNPWLIVAISSGAGANPIRTYISYSRDGGSTWSSEIDVSGFTRTAVQEERSWPALWLSPRTPGVAYVGAWETTGSNPDGVLYKTTDWGATWSVPSDIAPDLGHSIGFAMHVPFESNPSESLAYYGWFDRTSNIFKYRLYRSTSGSASDISPVDTGKKYGPARGLFSVRTLDTNRQEVILAGVYDDTDDEEVLGAGSAAVSAIWRSSDGGDTWTRKTADAGTTPLDTCILQVAFSADNASIWYGWGGGLLVYTENDGSTVDDKSPTGSIVNGFEIMGIFGGPTA